MARGKKSAQPRELVRLSPKQFSAAVAFIVLLVSAALLTGYILGVKSTQKGPHDTAALGNDHEAGKSEGGLKTGDSHSKAENATTITFYSALTKKEANERKIPEPGSGNKPAPKTVRVSSPVENPEQHTGGTVIQVGSYKDRRAAGEFLKGLIDSGYRGAVVRADLGPRGVWYRVRLGPYGSIKDARKALATLRGKMAIKGFLVKPGT
ncbi:MAG: SPOR domain-containing protein [Deltaproteobacteria bacterium]|nr:SPOR domain-containing protein [Deltaproteobacteria bacterium]